METLYVLSSLGQSITVYKLTTAHDLHTATAGSHESEERLRHLTTALADGHCLLDATEVVHLKEYQTRIAGGLTTLFAGHHRRGEADARQTLQVSAVGHDSAVIVFQLGKQLIDGTQLFDLIGIFAAGEGVGKHIDGGQTQRLLVAMVPDKGDLCHVFRCF